MEQLRPQLRNSKKSSSVLKEKILNFTRPSPNSFFDCHNPKAIKLITRLRLGLSHLREHKFKHSFQNKINPLCNFSQDIESYTHFFLHFHFLDNERRTLLSTICRLDSNLLDCTDYALTKTLLFGNTFQTLSNNFKIINASIDYILSSKRPDEQLFQMNSLISNRNSVCSFLFIYIIIVILFIYFSYFILPGIFQYIGLWRSCNFSAFFCLYFTLK